MSDAGAHVIIGAGQAGGRAAEAMRTAGFAGRVVLIGDEAHPPYERPPLSKSLLLGEADAQSTYLFKAPNALAEAGIEVEFDNPAVAVDARARQVQLASGKVIMFDRLLFATGGRVRRLQMPGADLEGVHYLRNLSDCRALRSALKRADRVVVIGGGFLGLEVAAAARQLGKQVTVLEIGKSVLARALPPLLGAIITNFHQSRGTEFLLGTRAIAIEGSHGKVSAVVCSGGVTLKADLVVASIGILPNDDLARAAGVSTDNGILVNEYGETDAPGVYAAGDVANHLNTVAGRRLRLESWQNAQNQAISVAKVMCGERKPHAELPWFWSDQFDLNIQLVGAPLEWDEICFRGDLASFRFSAFYLKAGRVVGAGTFNMAADMRAARQLITSAVQIGADKLVNPATDLLKVARSR